MTPGKHWTPKSGFFPCEAKYACPKRNEHLNLDKQMSTPEIKRIVDSRINIAQKALLNGDIDKNQFKRSVNHLRNEARKINLTRQGKKVVAGVAGVAVAGVGVGILTGAIRIGGVTVAELPNKTNNIESSQQTLNQLSNADTITINKALISFGDDWSVQADGIEIANVKGQAIQTLGDTYSMTNKDGNLVASQAEKTFGSLQGANTYDYNNTNNGVITKDNAFLQNYTLTDANGNTIGNATQTLNLVTSMDVKDANGEVEYQVQKATFSWGNQASLTVTKKVENPDVPVEDAIWVAMIANEITTTTQK